VRLGPLGTAANTGLLYQPHMIDDDVCGTIGGMKIGRGNRSTRRKPTPAPLCPPQIPYDQTPGSNPGRRGGKPATNRLSYGAASYAANVEQIVIGTFHKPNVNTTVCHLTVLSNQLFIRCRLDEQGIKTSCQVHRVSKRKPFCESHVMFG
jgi:hypothetical protein